MSMCVDGREVFGGSWFRGCSVFRKWRNLLAWACSRHVPLAERDLEVGDRRDDVVDVP